MSGNKRMDWICGLGAVVMVALTALYLGGGGLFLEAAAADMPYVQKLFDTSKVHTVDIVAQESDWEEMLQNAALEEYISCTVVIDGESYKNVAIRPKGNSSLSTVSGSQSDRYSFKIEFDHYDNNTTYYGLDKLCLNNVIQDNTYMKDFLCYRMMSYMGGDAPLTSYVWITVNGEDWGLYIGAEAIEEAYAEREYGADHGQIYKPDSMDMGGGGRGAQAQGQGRMEDMARGFKGMAGIPSDSESTAGEEVGVAETPWLPDGAEAGQSAEAVGRGNRGGNIGGNGDVLLVYSDDDPESYPNIFDNSVFDTVTDSDKERLIQALKRLNQGDILGSVNIDEVIRYFAVHNFVLNNDSYTGSIIHNYYLYEESGILSMIAWDYNLAFGGMGASGGNGATSTVNSPIDSPVSSGDISERPMISWIFGNEEYTELYHQVMDELISSYFESGCFEELITQTAEMIAPYVEKDPTAFCTYEEFEAGVEALREFCLLRAESVRGQLEGAIPSTTQGQSQDSSSLIDASHINVSDMGSQGGGMGQKEFTRNGEGLGTANEAAVGEEQENASLKEAEGDKALGAGQGGRMPEGVDGEKAPSDGGGEKDDDSSSSAAGEASSGTQTPEAQDGENSESQAAPGEAGGNAAENGTAPTLGNNMERQENFLGSISTQRENSENPEVWILLGVSALILIGGLLFAKLYR